MLRLVTYYVNKNGLLRTVLLALLRQKGRYTSSNIAKTIATTLAEYRLKKKVRYFISNNYNNNPTAINLLATEYSLYPA